MSTAATWQDNSPVRVVEFVPAEVVAYVGRYVDDTGYEHCPYLATTEDTGSAVAKAEAAAALILYPEPADPSVGGFEICNVPDQPAALVDMVQQMIVNESVDRQLQKLSRRVSALERRFGMPTYFED